MTNGVNIDWSLVKPADPVGDYANAFNIGRSMAGPPATGNAMGGGRPMGGNAMAAPTRPPPMQTPGDPAVALSPAQRQAASQRVEAIGALASALASRPYEERGAIIAHMAPALTASGLPAAAIGSFDPTDAALEAARAEAEQWRQRLAS